MVHPVEGFVAVEKFPSVAALNEWLDRNEVVREPRRLPEHRLLAREEPKPLAPQERARRDRIIGRLKQQLAATAEAMRIR
jgi:hypothetical protein